MEENKNINKPIIGLYQDEDPSTQPENSYRFALNAINETDQGDNKARSNEESNEICGSLPEGFIPIGKVYINNGRNVLFLVSEDSNVSVIGIHDKNLCTFTEHVNDSTSAPKDKLNFSLSHQIQAVYRLRLGCEDTIYWTDGLNTPKYYNFAKPEQFKKPDSTWSSHKFSLQKSYERIPEFSNLKVNDSGGDIPPGSINIAIQYLDESLNPTEFIVSSPTLKIYNDITTKDFAGISGSIQKEEPLNYPNTEKSVSITVDNLDNNYLFYRLAFIMATSGTGLVNEVYYSSPIPTHIKDFVFTGNNYEVRGTIEEVKQAEDFIGTADIIAQIDNRLVLGNTTGTSDNYCELQRFASQITVDCILKDVVLNNINDPSNPKNPSHEFQGGIGYMPGEIYSLGIVYIFEDMSLSPTYHIPGKAQGDGSTVFSPGNNVFPMSENNYSETDTYIDISTCQTSDYWGLDYNGNTLLGKPVRHHRFPLRTEVGTPLIKNTYGSVIYTDYYYLKIEISGELLLPIPCPESSPGCGSDEYTVFNFRVNYTVDGEGHSMIISVDPQYYADDVSNKENITIHQESPLYSSNNIVITGYEVQDVNGDYQDADTFDYVGSGYYTGDPLFSDSIGTSSSSTQSKVTTSKIFGLKISNIIKPTLSSPGSKEIIGYYIVRNNKEEYDKTILDSAVMFSTAKFGKYIGSGMIQPEFSGIFSEAPTRQKKVFSLINPEYKFNNKEYTSFDKLIHQGTYKRKESQKGLSWYNDVHPGTTYNEEIHKDKFNDDGTSADGDPISTGKDGWSLALLVRDTIVDFHAENVATIDKADIKNTFYLTALENQPINDFKEDVYNIAADNKIGILQTEKDITYSEKDLKYYVMYREVKNPYSNFMIRPYYKETVNPSYFNSPIEEEVIYNGDSYISPMRYNNSIFIDNRAARRITKNKAWTIVAGVILTAVGVIAAIFTAGAGLAVSVVGISIAAAAAGILVASSGIKGVNVSKAYGEAYEAGLKKTAVDRYTDTHFISTFMISSSPFGIKGHGTATPYGKDGYTDDTIMWMNDCVTDLWFESSINFHLRNGFAGEELPTYLPSPWYSESGQNWYLHATELGKKGWSYINGNQARYPVSTLESHVMRKLLGFDDSRNDSRRYLGFPLGEYYHVNKDYHRRNHEKVFFHLPLEYDCCSDCQEKFPHRMRYSEQSFQEDLSDSYRIFLPNNYRDIDGETGALTNIFHLNNNLFAHTEEALWLIPRNYQERVTDQIVSFIGTGEFMSQPPRKIIDSDSGSSGGSRHKWGTVKTPSGIVFISEHQNKIFLFDGQSLKPISNMGLSSYFKKNLEVSLDKEYYKIYNEKYPYSNNPSNPVGTGFISVYDSRKNRVLITKKDLSLGKDITQRVCTSKGENIYYPNFDEQVESQAALGYEFIQITEDCRLQFRKIEKTTEREKRMSIVVEELPEDLDIHFIYNNSGSFGADKDECLSKILGSIHQWVSVFGDNNPSWAGNSFIHPASDNRWLKYPEIVSKHYKEDTQDKKVLIVIINNDGSSDYHSASHDGSIPPPTQNYLDDYNNFVSNIYPSYKELSVHIIPFVLYPDGMECSPSSADRDTTLNNFKQIAGSIWGGTPHILDLKSEFLNSDGGMSYLERTSFINDLNTNNPYRMQGLRDFNWSGFWTGAITNTGPNFSPETFNSILVDYFSRYYSIEVVDSIYSKVVETYSYNYLHGESFKPTELFNNSWTLSFDLKDEGSWISWHSFLPNFYLESPEDFASWIYGNDNIWKHNKLGEFQNFYGKRYPFILEIVSASNPLVTRVWDYIRLSTKSMKYDSISEQFNDERFVTFNKALFYNSRQASGILNLIVKDTNSNEHDYLLQQVQNLSGDSIIIDRNERDWTINDLRDNRVDYTKAIFSERVEDLQNDYYIDKVLNPGVIDYNKDWQDLESFRDKYLVIRLIFDSFDDVKLVLNHTVETETNSSR